MNFYPVYQIYSLWMNDGLGPAEIGDRWREMLRRLGPLAPSMSNWVLGDLPEEQGVPLAEAERRMTAFIEHNAWNAEDWGATPQEGYGLVTIGTPVPRENGAADDIHISMTVGSKWRNRLEFQVGSPLFPNDFGLISYPIYKAALEVLASVWPCPWALAYTYSDSPAADAVERLTTGNRKPFEVAWIAYLSAPFAKGLRPPAEIICETTPGGGVILSAVEDRIDQSNPDHMRRSRMLEAIMTERVGDGDPPLNGPAEHPARGGPC